MIKYAKYISKPLYYFTHIHWFLNAIFVVMSFFCAPPSLFYLFFFVSIGIQGIASGAFSAKTAIDEAAKIHTAMDRCLVIAKSISLPLSAVCFFSLFVVGGSPQIIDGAYCLVNHGQIIRYVSSNSFLYFSICDRVVFSSVILYFSAILALRIRTMYRNQNTTAQ